MSNIYSVPNEIDTNKNFEMINISLESIQHKNIYLGEKTKS